MITKEFKLRVIRALLQARENFGGSDAKFATSIGINAAQWSRVKRGDIEKVLSNEKWIHLGRKYNVQPKQRTDWKIAKTPAFEAITQMLETCQTESVSCIICDIPDIGKTFTAQVYANSHKNAIYVDCSQVKTKNLLIRHIAKQFGVGYTGRYIDVYNDLVYYIRILPTPPIVMLDEVGDLQYSAFLELKAIWNATERYCAWTMIGADGLKEKMRRSIDLKKVGYTELFSRYGGKYQRISPENTSEQQKFNRLQAALIIQANAPKKVDVQRIIAKTNGSLRRIYTELSKLSA